MDFYLLGNSNNYVIKRLRDENGNLVEGASIEVEIAEYSPESGRFSAVFDTDGGTPNFPVDFVDEGGGNYRASIQENLDLEINKEYLAIIQGTAGGRVLYEIRKVFAQRRLTR